MGRKACPAAITATTTQPLPGGEVVRDKQTKNNASLEKDGSIQKILAYTRINDLAFKVSSVHID